MAQPADEVSPAPFGALCNGTGDDTAALQRAADEAAVRRRPLLIPAGTCVVSAPIRLRGKVSVVGVSETSSHIVGKSDGPIFDWAVGSADVTGAYVARLTMSFGGKPASKEAVAIRIRGDSAKYFQFNTFENLTLAGFHRGFDIDAGVHRPGNWLENYAAWNTFDKISIISSARSPTYGWFYPNGSGTGNIFRNVKALIAWNGAVFRFEGNAAVGDLLISGHFGATAPGGKVLSLGPHTTYNQNIQINASQIDAQATLPFDIPATTSVAGISYGGNNSGGDTVLRTPASTQGSVISDLGSDVRTAGKQSAFAAGQAIHAPVFRIAFAPGSYTGTSCTVVVAGVVGGVAGGAATRAFLIGHEAQVVRIVDAGVPVSTSGSADFFSIRVEPKRSYAEVTVTARPRAGAGSTLDAQIRCSGGAYALSRV